MGLLVAAEQLLQSGAVDWEQEAYPSYADFLALPVFAVCFPTVRFFLDRFVFELGARLLKNDDSESLASKEITEEVDEAAVATSSPRINAENQEKFDVDGVSDIHSLNQIGDSPVSKTLDSAVVQTVPESSRSTARTGSGDPYESNLVGPSIMSAPVSTSGHIAYSGNISLRSESSATSTRSFAFPVLQREWISSPVRMAKAERRRHLGWRKGLVCCKF